MSLSIRNTNVQVSDLQAGNLADVINLQGLRYLKSHANLAAAAVGSYACYNASNELVSLGVRDAVLYISGMASAAPTGGATTFTISRSATVAAGTALSAALTVANVSPPGTLGPAVSLSLLGSATTQLVVVTTAVAAITNTALDFTVGLLVVSF